MIGLGNLQQHRQVPVSRDLITVESMVRVDPTQESFDMDGLIDLAWYPIGNASRARLWLAAKSNWAQLVMDKQVRFCRGNTIHKDDVKTLLQRMCPPGGQKDLRFFFKIYDLAALSNTARQLDE